MERMTPEELRDATEAYQALLRKARKEASEMVEKCQQCGESHQTCRFDAGSLTCIRERCRNPHHNGKRVVSIDVGEVL